MVRLFENKASYGLNCEEIADILNFYNGHNYGESAYRKYWKAFNEGRLYERNANPRNPHIRILSISDLHIPFQKPIEVFGKYANKIDVLQINGDILDCAAISKFSKVRRTSVIGEIIEARSYLIDLIEFLRPARVVVTYGNHDVRLENYLVKNLDTDIIELMPRTPIDYILFDGITHYDKETRATMKYDPLIKVFPSVKIEYTDNWWCQIGQTIFCHPMAFSSMPMKTAEKALLFFRNEGLVFTSLVMAHTHRVGMYKIGSTELFEQGACCDTSKMHYHNGQLVNSQKEGYVYLEQDSDGAVTYYDQVSLN